MTPGGTAVTTVLGPRQLHEGVIDAHAHIWIAPVPGGAPDAPVLDDEHAITTELRAFARMRGVALIDCQPPGCGRDPRRLVRIAEATGVDVIASTGFHLARYYPPGAAALVADADDLAAIFVAELCEGMVTDDGERVGACAGVVKAAHEGGLDADFHRRISAATAAACAVGVPLVVHTERGGHVEQLAQALLALGMSAQDIMLCHLDKRPDLGLHRELAQAGFLLEYDTFLRPRYEPERNVWPLLDAMLAEGHARSIACATDLADRSMWRFGGHPIGVLGLAGVVPDGLRRRGASDAQVRALIGGNVAARLQGARSVAI